MKSEKQLLEQRANIIAQVQDKWADVKKEQRAANQDELDFFDKADVDVKQLTSEIADAQKATERNVQAQKNAETYQSLIAEKAPEELRSVLQGTAKFDEKQHRSLLNKWIKSGMTGNDLTPEERSVLATVEKRGTSTQISSTTTLGGYAMTEAWVAELEKTMLYFGGAMEACGVKYRSAGGGDMHITTLNDTANKGAIIGQGTGDTVKDLTFGEILLKSWSYTSGLIKWSWETMADLAFNPEAETREVAAERLGRIFNEHFTTGDNSNKPQGLAPGSTLGKAAASATAVTRTELLDLIHSVDRAYRSGPKVGFMFNDATLAAFKKLTVGTNDDRPLWQPSMREGEPDRIEGHKYWVNSDMPAMTTGLRSILFGNFDKYCIRQTGDYILAKSTERYIEERAVAFFLFARFDGRYLNTAAIKHIIQA